MNFEIDTLWSPEDEIEAEARKMAEFQFDDEYTDYNSEFNPEDPEDLFDDIITDEE